jgi:hypothetical protein
MLVNDSYNHKEVNRKIVETVGKPFGLMQRIKMKGNGSPRMEIVESTGEIKRLLHLDNNADWCYIELRPKGIIIRFRSLLETFALVIPYWKLVMYKTDGDLYTIYKDEHSVRIRVTAENQKRFIKKIAALKALDAAEMGYEV